MKTTMEMNKTKTTEELAATTSTLGKNIKEITGLIVSLTRYIPPRRAVAVNVDDV